jgi:hypothetical protein
MLDFAETNLESLHLPDKQTRLELLKASLFNELVEDDNLKTPKGLKTGITLLDQFLLWQGLPLGEVSLLHGAAGTGATSLWAETCKFAQQEGGWAAWVNSSLQLHPQFLRKRQINLNQLLVVDKPADNTQMFWILQELISSQLFTLIGCHWPKEPLKIHQLQKLKKLARQYQVALVFVSESELKPLHANLSLVVKCERDFFTVERAQHRLTPFTTSNQSIGGKFYANSLFESAKQHRALSR